LTILLIITSAAGCGEKTVTPSGNFFAQIAADPGKYNGKTVTFDGYYFAGFEIEVVCENLVPQEGWEGNYVPAGIKIWAEGYMPKAVYSNLYTQEKNPTGYPAEYGKIEVTGVFTYGAKYGHMDAYNYHLTMTDAKLLDWKP